MGQLAGVPQPALPSSLGSPLLCRKGCRPDPDAGAPFSEMTPILLLLGRVLLIAEGQEGPGLLAMRGEMAEPLKEGGMLSSRLLLLHL